MIVDTHSHLNANAFSKDFDEIAKRTLAAGMWMVNVGMNYETSKKAIEIANQYPEGVFASIGLHPTDAVAEFLTTKFQGEDFDIKKYRDLALGAKKIVAVGETGLDYYHKPKGTAKLQAFKEKQKKIFLEQLHLAESLQLPVILHCRMAHQDLLEILTNYSLPTTNYKLTGVVHCFTGTVEEMKEYIKLGFYIGINAIIFKLPLDEVVKECPLENMVAETDCPYLTPPAEGKNRNEPLFIQHTIQKIAELKGVTFDQIAQKTTENAKALFNI